MKGGSISSRRPLRNLDSNGPGGVLLPLAARGLEVQFLQALGDGPYATGPDGTVVHLNDGEGRVDVGARAFCAGRDGVVRRTPPGRDADLQARKLHVVAHGDREDREFGLTLQVHSHGLGGLVSQGTDVGVLARGVATQDLQRDIAELVDGVGQLYTQQPAGPLEALVVLAHLQDLQRPAPLAPVRPYALEDARAVV